MLLIWPVLGHIALVFAVLIVMGHRRFQAVRNKVVAIADIAVSPAAWPDTCRQASNNFANQFETPVLFYALSGIAIYIGEANAITAAFAWGFVVSRIVHSTLHITTNVVMQRFYAFMAGIGCLLAMWIWIVFRLTIGDV